MTFPEHRTTQIIHTQCMPDKGFIALVAALVHTIPTPADLFCAEHQLAVSVVNLEIHNLCNPHRNRYQPVVEAIVIWCKAVGTKISGGVLYTFTFTVSKAKHPSLVATLTT